MLTVKSYLDKSQIDGIGVFAGEDILPGTIVCRSEFEILYTPEEFEQLEDWQKLFVRTWGWKDKLDGLHHLSLDNDRFMNHSDNPNTTCDETGLTIATRLIRRGEEILCNYAQFEAEPVYLFKIER